MKDVLITYEEFEHYMNEIQITMELQEKLIQASAEFTKQCYNDECSLYFPSLATSVIRLLECITNDQEKWIEHYIYELEFGRYASDSIYTHGNHTVCTSLYTVRDLWNLLNSDYVNSS